VTLRKSLLAVLALLAGLVVLYVILGRTVHAPPQSLKDLKWEAARPVPQVPFIDEGGRTHALTEYRGRYVLLNLWGTWCAPCVRELPALARLAAQTPGKRFAVVAVAIPPGTVERARAFLDSHGSGNLEAYFDSQTMFLRSFRASALPVTILIDPEGREIARAFGAEEWNSPEAIAYLKERTKS
jgi:thiol-disulfide isomerase/thioredoxin